MNGFGGVMLLFIGVLVFSLETCASFIPPISRNITNANRRRWYTALKADTPFMPWPQGEDKISRITYCYAGVDAFDKLVFYVDQGWGIWKNALGELKKDHSLDFVEFESKDRDHGNRYCYQPVKKFGDERVPNPEIPDGTLVIDFVPNSFGSTIGFREKMDDDRFDRHRMVLDPGRSKKYYEYAHEIGHVIGLLHEHQRPDRDTDVKFECKNLDDYESVRAGLKDPNEMETLCTNAFAAEDHGFSAKEFVKYQKDNPFEGKHDAAFDVESIMMYESGVDVRKGNDPKRPEQCPLAKWENGELALIQLSGKPTRQDVDGVQRLYPPVPK